jgi:hypothetical protein
MKAIQIFNFLRGAIRSSFGVEDFRGKRIVVVGTDTIGQELLSLLCFDNVSLFFVDNSLVNYNKAHMICKSVNVIANSEVDIDIIIDFTEGYVCVNGNSSTKDFNISDIGDDPYNQGIHEYYM